MAQQPTQYEHWSKELRELCERAELAIEISRQVREQTRRAVEEWWRVRARASSK
jgi:hypothetical protein